LSENLKNVTRNKSKVEILYYEKKATEEARYVILFDFVFSFACFYILYLRTGTFASRERMQAGSDRIE